MRASKAEAPKKLNVKIDASNTIHSFNTERRCITTADNKKTLQNAAVTRKIPDLRNGSSIPVPIRLKASGLPRCNTELLLNQINKKEKENSKDKSINRINIKACNSFKKDGTNSHLSTNTGIIPRSSLTLANLAKTKPRFISKDEIHHKKLQETGNYNIKSALKNTNILKGKSVNDVSRIKDQHLVRGSTALKKNRKVQFSAASCSNVNELGVGSRTKQHLKDVKEGPMQRFENKNPATKNFIERLKTSTDTKISSEASAKKVHSLEDSIEKENSTNATPVSKQTIHCQEGNSADNSLRNENTEKGNYSEVLDDEEIWLLMNLQNGNSSKSSIAGGRSRVNAGFKQLCRKIPISPAVETTENGKPLNVDKITPKSENVKSRAIESFRILPDVWNSRVSQKRDLPAKTETVLAEKKPRLIEKGSILNEKKTFSNQKTEKECGVIKNRTNVKQARISLFKNSHDCKNEEVLRLASLQSKPFTSKHHCRHKMLASPNEKSGNRKGSNTNEVKNIQNWKMPSLKKSPSPVLLNDEERKLSQRECIEIEVDAKIKELTAEYMREINEIRKSSPFISIKHIQLSKKSCNFQSKYLKLKGQAMYGETNTYYVGDAGDDYSFNPIISLGLSSPGLRCNAVKNKAVSPKNSKIPLPVNLSNAKLSPLLKSSKIPIVNEEHVESDTRRLAMLNEDELDKTAKNNDVITTNDFKENIQQNIFDETLTGGKWLNHTLENSPETKSTINDQQIANMESNDIFAHFFTDDYNEEVFYDLGKLNEVNEIENSSDNNFTREYSCRFVKDVDEHRDDKDNLGEEDIFDKKSALTEDKKVQMLKEKRKRKVKGMSFKTQALIMIFSSIAISTLMFLLGVQEEDEFDTL